jgi:LacI family transcriptional regulator
MNNRIHKVALLLDDGRSFDRGLLRGIARYAALHQPWTFLRPAAFYQRLSGLVRLSLKELRRCRPDGVIMNGSHLEKEVVRLRIPAIVVSIRHVISGACHIVGENHEVAALAADHLVGQGLQNFAFAGFDRAVWSLARREYFCRRLADHGFMAPSHLAPLLASETKRRSYEMAMVRWLKLLPKPVGIMACNDEFARLLSELCRVHGLRVPEDVALIGVDNDELICELSSPPLSSVGFATERAGYEAAALLDALMAGKEIQGDNIVVHAGHLVARQSTDLLAMEDEEVVKALRFIRENGHRLIQVHQVVEATLLSYRTLHDRFRQALGHSLVREINRRRAAHIAKMLATTNDSIYRIAQSIGYEAAGHMARFFHREMGMTPRAYRNRHQGPTGDR